MNEHFRKVQLHLVDGSQYRSASPGLLYEMLPEAAGIYLWTRRLGDAAQAPAGGRARLTAIEKHLQAPRDLRPERARLGRYRRIDLYDDPRPLTGSSHRRLDSLAAQGADDLAWVLLAASVFQRPLYVGKATNFRERIPQHFKYATRFAKDLTADGLAIEDCMVTLLAVGRPPDGSALSGPATQGSSTDKQIQLAESLVIRTLNPIYNVRMD